MSEIAIGSRFDQSVRLAASCVEAPRVEREEPWAERATVVGSGTPDATEIRPPCVEKEKF